MDVLLLRFGLGFAVGSDAGREVKKRRGSGVCTVRTLAVVDYPVLSMVGFPSTGLDVSARMVHVPALDGDGLRGLHAADMGDGFYPLVTLPLVVPSGYKSGV